MNMGTLLPEMPQLLQEMGVRYDPDRLAEVLARRRLAINLRALRIATTLGGFITQLVGDYAMGALEANQEARAKELSAILARLGPSFAKVGQALSARPDLLPKPYLEALAQLQDQLPPFDTATALELIREDLGRPATEIFSELTPEPVASASLGQVYKGLLISTGQQVAVKVQRPRIGESIATDMLLLRRLMQAVDRYLPQVEIQSNPIQPLVPLVDEFAARLFGELDYILEGQSCERFRELYCHVPRVRTPDILWEATSRRVLTMSWIDGVKLTNKPAMDAAGLDIVDFVNVGIQCTLRQLLEHGFFHADPHPGNLLATTSGDLVYLDFGMMSSAPQRARYAIISHVTHLVNRDYDAMCRDYYELEFMDRSIDTSPIAPELARFFDEVLDRSVSELNFRAIVDGLGDVLFQFPFRVPPFYALSLRSLTVPEGLVLSAVPNYKLARPAQHSDSSCPVPPRRVPPFYALILRSLTVLEGLALTADPNYKLLGAAYPYMARRILTDPAPELRASLEEMVLAEGKFRWNRLDNLMREGSKSSELTGEQLWLLADYLCSDQGASIRKPLVAEVVRLFDAYLAEQARLRIRQRSGRRLAERVVPVFRGEVQLAVRARRIACLLQDQLGGRAEPLPELRGSGPLGLPLPWELRGMVEQAQAALAPHWPRLQALSDTPGAIEARATLLAGLRQRMAARTARLLLGYSEGEPQPKQVEDSNFNKRGRTTPPPVISG